MADMKELVERLEKVTRQQEANRWKTALLDLMEKMNDE